MILRLVMLATALVGCAPNTGNLQLGTGDVSIRAEKAGGYERTEHWPVATAWAQPYLSFPISGDTNFFDDDDGYGGISINFSGETTSPLPPTCNDSQLLSPNPTTLSLQTTRHGKAELAPGDVPFVSGVDLTAPVTADFDEAFAVDAGHVTITAVDDEHISGTFDGSGTDGYESLHVVGYFDVPICSN